MMWILGWVGFIHLCTHVMLSPHSLLFIYNMFTLCVHLGISPVLHMAVYSGYNFLFPLKCSKAIQSTVIGLSHLQNHTFNILQMAHHDGNPSYWCVYSSLYHMAHCHSKIQGILENYLLKNGYWQVCANSQIVCKTPKKKKGGCLHYCIAIHNSTFQ